MNQGASRLTSGWQWPQPRVAVALLIAATAIGMSIGYVSGVTRSAAAPKVHMVGFLASRGSQPWHQSFRDGLRELGYVDGVNLVLDERYAEGDAARLEPLATELVDRGVEVIVATDSASIAAAQRA